MLCKKGGVEYTEVQVANDGISVVTNPGLEISCLSIDQLKQLWADDTVTNYSELGDDADTGEPLPDAEVSLYGPGTDSGTFDYFTDAINGEEGLSRKDYQASEDDNVLVQGVSGDEDGLGYFGFSYYEQNADALNLVSVDERRRLRRPERRDDPGRLVRAALASAVHVSVGRGAAEARGRRRSSSSSPTTTTRSPRRR